VEKQGIKYVLYCDDGLFYGNEPFNFLEIAQEILDRHGIGAYFAESKSRRVKWDGIWLTKLKLVGLEYDPFNDVLSAATRNGATLKLEVGAIGLFSSEKLKLKPLPDIKEES
jgi:hypothetical protein